MRAPIAVEQRAEALASPLEWTYVLDFWADRGAENVGVSVKTNRATFDAEVAQVDEYMWTARVECLDTLSDTEVTATADTGSVTAAFGPWQVHVVFDRPWRIDAAVEAPLEQHFAHFLTSLKGAPEAQIRVMYRQGDPAIDVPVVFVPLHDADPSVATMIADAFKTWFAANQPPREGAQIVLSFVTATLTISNATIDVANATDLR